MLLLFQFILESFLSIDNIYIIRTLIHARAKLSQEIEVGEELISRSKSCTIIHLLNFTANTDI